jgi:hypothetical protein
MGSYNKKCLICNEEYNFNTGYFTIHLVKIHNLSLEDYIIKYDLNGIAPICECGFCQERPLFYRGKFFKYHKSHNTYEYLQKQWLLKYGEPKCPTCGNIITKWNRGKPNVYCKISCQPSQWNQEKVKNTVKQKYQVDNVFQLKEIKEKSKASFYKNHNVKPDDTEKLKLIKQDINNKKKITKKEKYGNENYVNLEKIKKTITEKYGFEHASQIPINRINASVRMKKNNPMFDRIVVEKNCKTNMMNEKKYYFNTQKYKNTELYYQSTYEYDFLELCEHLNILKKVKNGNVYKYDTDNKNKHWLITDFSIGNYEIEIKSSYILEKQGGYHILNAKQKSVESYGKKYLLILDKNYDDFLKIF